MINDVKDILLIGTRVLVEVEKIEESTDGGIILPTELRQQDQDSVSKGTLIDMGGAAFVDLINPETETVPHVGLKVFFVRYAGKGLTINEKEYRVINDEDIYAFGKDKEEKCQE